MRPLEVLYKQALKVMDRKSLKHHHCNILSKYKLFSFDSLVLLSRVRLVFRIIHNSTTPPLRGFFQFRREQSCRNSRSASNADLTIPLRRTAFGRSAFSFTAIKHWNTLPVELKTCTDFNSFFYGAKKTILSNQSCQH